MTRAKNKILQIGIEAEPSTATDLKIIGREDVFHPMYPTIQPYDEPDMQEYEVDGFIEFGPIYILQMQKQLLVRRIFPSSKPDFITLKADNKAYEDMEILTADITKLVKIHCLRRRTSLLEEKVNNLSICEEYEVRAFDDCMSPTIASNDKLILCEPKNDHFTGGHIYLLDIDGDRVVRRVFESQDKTKFNLVADNEFYPAYEVPKSWVEQMLLVSAVIKQIF